MNLKSVYNGPVNKTSSHDANINLQDTKKINSRSEDLSKAHKSQMGLDADFNKFIRMLVTQLKNQDPTNPMDSNQFTQQIVAFTGVEQAVATNINLEKLIDLHEGNAFTEAASLVGSDVTYDNSKIDLFADRAQINYRLEPIDNREIKKTIVNILNNKGEIVAMLQGETKAGETHTISWDGENLAGKKCERGEYRVRVSAYDVNNVPISLNDTNLISGKVQEAQVYNGKIVLVVNNKQIELNKVMSISQGKNTQSSPVEIENNDIVNK